MADVDIDENVNTVAAIMVSGCTEFKALGPKMLAAVKARALTHVKTGAFLNSIKLKRWPSYADNVRYFSSPVRDWVVYSDDPSVTIIEFGATYTPEKGPNEGKTITQKPQNIFTGAIDAI